MRTNWRNSFLWAFLAVVAVAIAPSSAVALADTEVLLSMPEPPDGYAVLKEPIEIDGKRLGQKVVIVNEALPGRVVVTVETSFDRSTKPARVAATKGYVNGMAGMLKEAGFKLVERKLPDLANADFATPLEVDMTFSHTSGTKLYMRQFVFFTKHGYNIQIAANDPQDLENLTKWAQRIKPAD